MLRLKNLDRLKALSIFAVMFIHAPESAAIHSTAWQFFNQFCRFAVPCFFIVSGFFFTRSYQAAANGDAVARRSLGRLLAVFLFWSFFYAVVPPRYGEDPPYFSPSVPSRLHYILWHPKAFLLTGDVLHLWFLSALLGAIGFVWLCLRSGRPWLAGAVGAILYGWGSLCIEYASFLPVPARLVAVSLPFCPVFCASFLVGLGAMTAVYQWRPGVVPAAWLATGGLLLQWTEAWTLQDPARGVAMLNHGFLVGTVPFAAGIFFLALALQDTGPDWLAWTGTCTLGVYVIHLYVSRLLYHSPVGAALAGLPLLYCAVIYLIALGASVALSSVPYIRRLVV